MTATKGKLSNTIAAKLLTRVFYFYIIITFTVTLMHMIAEYTFTKNDINTDLHVFHGSFEPGLAIAIWNQEDLGLKASMEAMVKVPQIIGAKVVDDEGQLVSAIGEFINANGEHVYHSEGVEEILRDSSLFSGLFWEEAPLNLTDENTYNVGSLTLYSSRSFVFARVQHGYVFIIINAIIKTLALWGIVLLLSRPMVTQPLKKLETAIKNWDVDNIKQFRFNMKYAESTELKALEDAFNTMIKNWSESIRARDIAKGKIVKLNQELEQKVEERTQSLTQANNQLMVSLDTLEKTRDELVESEKMAALGGLVAGVAHEINTPIGVGVTALSHLEQQLNEVEKDLNNDQLSRIQLDKFFAICKDGVNIAYANLQQAAKLVKSFKQVAVDQSFDDLRNFDLRTYVNHVISAISPNLKHGQHKIKVVDGDDINITSYPGAYYQLFSNLIMNSLKHGFENIQQGCICIDISTTDDVLTIHYQDDGRGMTEEEQRKIFDPFYTTKRGMGGSGLGGHIAYNIVVRKLHGKIVCESSPGEGTNFIIQVPVNLKLNLLEDDPGG